MNEPHDLAKGPMEHSHDSSFCGVKNLPLHFSVTNSGAVLQFGGSDLQLTSDEFQILREGDVPASVRSLIPSELDIQTVIEAARASILPEIRVTISVKDEVGGLIRNGTDGLIQWEQIVKAKAENHEDSIKKVVTARFNGNLGPVYLLDGETIGLGVQISNQKFQVLPIRDFFTFLRSELSIVAPLMQKTKEVINSWTSQTISSGQYVNFRTSPIYLKEEKINVDYPHMGDVANILSQLRDFYHAASYPLAYLTILSWALMAPLHDELKRHAKKMIQTPQVIATGKTKAGKTELGNFVIGRGFSMDKDKFFYSYERVATRFTLMQHLGESSLPALFDDLPPDWILQNRGNLKSYVQTGHFGDRGRSDLSIAEYRGRRSFLGTVNQTIRFDDDLAASLRLIILRFTEKHRAAKNIEAWDKIFFGLPTGFMYEIFRTIFEGQKIDAIVTDVERFETSTDWVNYGLLKLNSLCQRFGISEFPNSREESELDDDSNALEVAQAFLGENERIQRNSAGYFDKQIDTQIKVVQYRSPIEGEFMLEYRLKRILIWFTPGAFKTLVARQNLKLPYKNAADFLNNIASCDTGVKVENEGKLKSKRFGSLPLRAFCISVPLEVEDHH